MRARLDADHSAVKVFGVAAVVGFGVAVWGWSMAMARYRSDVSTYWRIAGAGVAVGVVSGAVLLAGRVI